MSANEVLFHPGRTLPKKKKRRPIRKSAHQRSKHSSHQRSLNLAALDRFSRVMSAYGSGNHVDLGPPFPGTIRILYPPYGQSNDWLHTILHSHDRSLGEWKTLIETYKRGVSFLPPDNPYNTIHLAESLSHILLRNLRLRWILRKWIVHMRRRKMDTRIIGTIDLYTVRPIPSQCAVYVYDISSKTKYVFHTHTMIQTFLSGLSFQVYATPYPRVPKNPYTNIPWTLGQILVIIEQIVHNSIRNNKMLPHALQLYHASLYNIDVFREMNLTYLQIEAATSFFSDHADPVVLQMYLEVYDDLFDIIVTKFGAWHVVRRALELRKLPTDLQTRWDDILMLYWIYQNHGMIIYKNSAITSLSDANLELHTLYYDTYQWWKELPKRNVRTLSGT